MSAIEPMLGQEKFAAAPQKVYSALTDLDAMAATIPDLESSQKIDDRTLECVVKPGFSFIRGKLKCTIRLAELDPGKALTMQIASSGIGMAMDVVSKLRLEPADGGAATTLNWSAEVTRRSGLIALVGKSLIQAAAEKTIKDGWEKLRARL
jgi:carbon monoxide dehydrogenase subunit G